VPECNAHIVIEPYGKRLNRASWQEFLNFWSGYRWIAAVAGLAPPAVIQAYKAIPWSTRSMVSVAEAVGSGAIGLTASLVGTYLRSRRKGAEALDTKLALEIADERALKMEALGKLAEQAREHARTIEDRDRHVMAIAKELEEARRPKRTPAEEQRYRSAKAALERLGKDGATVLRHLLTHGKIEFGFYSSPLPDGMNAETTGAILSQCVREHLVTKQHITGPDAKMVYTIAPGMMAALEDLLYAPDIP
jgi:hypothetical protein